MNKPTLYASSPTLDGIKAAIGRFYAGSTITLTPESDTRWGVYTLKGKCSTYVELKGKRYRFCSQAN